MHINNDDNIFDEIIMVCKWRKHSVLILSRQKRDFRFGLINGIQSGSIKSEYFFCFVGNGQNRWIS